VKVLAAILVVIAVIFGGVDFLVQSGATFRFLISARFRQRIRERWSTRSRFNVVGEASFAVFCFLTFILLLAAVLWAVFVGPIPPVHEW
jgi:hypothetical protein